LFTTLQRSPDLFTIAANRANHTDSRNCDAEIVISFAIICE
jgi:hypothetical protein